jgi:hypothetical protein
MHLWQDRLQSGRNVGHPAVDGTDRKRLSDDSKASVVAVVYFFGVFLKETRSSMHLPMWLYIVQYGFPVLRNVPVPVPKSSVFFIAILPYHCTYIF